MPRYQWLLFDADGTLFDFDRAETAALSRAFDLLGMACQTRHLTVYQSINKALWQEVEEGKIKPAVVKAQRFEQLFEAIGVSFSAAAFSDHYLECLADCSQLISDAAEVIEMLSGKYRLAILTNGLQAVQRRRLASSPIRSHIAEMIISEEIGFSKPARDFFTHALTRLGNPSPRETLMIGDGWGSDMLGAVQYGMDACWYNPERKPRPSSLEVTREIASLKELVEWLE